MNKLSTPILAVIMLVVLGSYYILKYSSETFYVNGCQSLVAAPFERNQVRYYCVNGVSVQICQTCEEPELGRFTAVRTDRHFTSNECIPDTLLIVRYLTQLNSISASNLMEFSLKALELRNQISDESPLQDTRTALDHLEAALKDISKGVLNRETISSYEHSVLFVKVLEEQVKDESSICLTRNPVMLKSNGSIQQVRFLCNLMDMLILQVRNLLESKIKNERSNAFIAGLLNEIEKTNLGDRMQFSTETTNLLTTHFITTINNGVKQYSPRN